jgi:hypothetical protein
MADGRSRTRADRARDGLTGFNKLIPELKDWNDGKGIDARSISVARIRGQAEVPFVCRDRDENRAYRCT